MYLRSIIAIAGMLVTSCLSPHQTVVTDTGGGTWSESAEIEIPNADTVTPRDLYIVVRYTDSFRDDTLRLTIRTISPDSLVFEESYTLGLPPRRHPAALAEEASVPYRRHVIFPDSGIYRMAFTPAMPVRGVAEREEMKVAAIELASWNPLVNVNANASRISFEQFICECINLE